MKNGNMKKVEKISEYNRGEKERRRETKRKGVREG